MDLILASELFKLQFEMQTMETYIGFTSLYKSFRCVGFYVRTA